MEFLELMQETDILSAALQVIQKQVIGVFNPIWTNKGDDYECVLSEDEDGMLFTMNVGNLLGLQTLTIHKDQGKYKKFPDGKTLWDMMKDPTGLHNWWKENIQK